MPTAMVSPLLDSNNSSCALFRPRPSHEVQRVRWKLTCPQVLEPPRPFAVEMDGRRVAKLALLTDSLSAFGLARGLPFQLAQLLLNSSLDGTGHHLLQLLGPVRHQLWKVVSYSLCAFLRLHCSSE